MGGGDKGLLMLAGEALAIKSLRRLASQTGQTVINANRNLEQYQALGKTFGAKVVADQYQGFFGPLAGIHAGLCAAQTRWALFAPCDSPFLPLNLAHQLSLAAQTANARVVIASANERTQPAFMLAQTELAEDLAAFLSADGRKIDLWFPRHAHAVAQFEDASAFVNINTPEDLAAAENRLQKDEKDN